MADHGQVNPGGEGGSKRSKNNSSTTAPWPRVRRLNSVTPSRVEKEDRDVPSVRR